MAAHHRTVAAHRRAATGGHRGALRLVPLALECGRVGLQTSVPWGPSRRRSWPGSFYRYIVPLPRMRPSIRFEEYLSRNDRRWSRSACNVWIYGSWRGRGERPSKPLPRARTSGCTVICMLATSWSRTALWQGSSTGATSQPETSRRTWHARGCSSIPLVLERSSWRPMRRPSRYRPERRAGRALRVGTHRQWGAPPRANRHLRHA